ncbi:hypothetical protein ACHQM5_005128 [Ranunculus cassubicifolius]
MQMERRYSSSSTTTDHVIIDLDSLRCKEKIISRPLSSSGSVNSICSNGNGGCGNGNGGANYIEHHVSKMDTLAGVAIKYGVEVSDIKKMNGLVTDLQMFALKSLQIPLPGRHPPSPIISNGSATPGESSSEHSQSRKAHFDVLESLQSLKFDSPDRKVTPAMSSLQGYYRLKTPPKSTVEGTEMSVYGTGKAHAHYLEDGPFLDPSAHSEPPPLGRHRKSRSLANGFHVDELSADVPVTGDVESDKLKKPVRRRQKADSEYNSAPPKGLAQRAKSTNRITVAADESSSWLNPLPLGLGDTWELVKPTPLTNFFDGVRKSSSTSNLQEQESNGSSNWAWNLNLKPDLQVFSAATLARPIFDGLPKPISGRRGKAALD